MQGIDINPVEHPLLLDELRPVLGDVAVVPDSRRGELERLGEEAPVQRRLGPGEWCPKSDHGAVGILARACVNGGVLGALEVCAG